MQQYLNWTTHSITWFKKAHDRSDLVIKPPFQRNPVWTEAQKAFLIDSVLRGFPIPELYLQEVVDEKGSEQIIVVDGQQRIRACLEFLEGGFSLDSKKSPEWGDLSFDDLTGDDKKRVYNYKFVIRLLPDVPEESLRTMFARLNQNVVALNKQELRHATYWGTFIKTMEQLAERDFWSAAGIFTVNDVRRMLDIEYVSELAIGHLHGLQNKKTPLDKWYPHYETDFDEDAEIESVFAKVLGEIEAVLPNIRSTRWKKKSDFYTLFLVFAGHTDALPLASDTRTKCSKLLIEFGSRVTQQLKIPMERDQDIVKYAGGVERAASDLANRKDRAEALEERLSAVWGSK